MIQNGSPSNPMDKPQNRKAAQRFVESCQARGKITFSLAELQEATGLTSTAAREGD